MVIIFYVYIKDEVFNNKIILIGSSIPSSGIIKSWGNAVTSGANSYFNYANEKNLIKNKKIGIVKDYAYIELLKNKYPNINISEVKSVEDGLNKVKDKELYGFIDTLTTVSYVIQNKFVSQLKISGKIDESWDLSMGTRVDEPLLSDILNKAINTVTFEEKQVIFNKWIPVNIGELTIYSDTTNEAEDIGHLPTHCAIKVIKDLDNGYSQILACSFKNGYVKTKYLVKDRSLITIESEFKVIEHNFCFVIFPDNDEMYYNGYISEKFRTYYLGPKGGCYYVTRTGSKVYVDRNVCN